jgi:hypothetical protein
MRIEVDPQLTAWLWGRSACQARWRAAARAARTRSRCGSPIRSSSRYAVGMLAAGPNRASRSRSTSIPLTASAPLAIATAGPRSTWPGGCTGIPGRCRSAPRSPRWRARSRWPVPAAARSRRMTPRPRPSVRADADPAPPALRFTCECLPARGLGPSDSPMLQAGGHFCACAARGGSLYVYLLYG